MIKIAFLSEICNPRSGSRAPIEIAKQLSKKYKISFFCYDTNLEKKTFQELKKQKIDVVLFTPPPFFLGKFFLIPRLLKKLKQGKYELVSFHGTFPFFLAAKLSGIPIIRTYYGTQVDAFLERFSPDQKLNIITKTLNSFFNIIIIGLEKFYFKNSFQAVAISNYTALEAQKISGRKIPKIYLGADHFSAPRPKTKTPKEAFLLSVSRLTPYKGFHLLINTFNNLSPQFKNLKLYIVGSVRFPNYLTYLKKSASSGVIFLKDIGDQKLAKLYQQALFYVTADRFLFFGFPPLEAAFFKKPTIAFDFAAASEIIDQGKTGFVAKNKKRFENFCLKLITGNKLRKTLGENACRKVKKQFTWKKCGRNYINFFDKILKQ